MIVRKIEVEELPLSGAFLIRPLEFKDERGSFYKFYTDETLKAIGTNSMFPEEYLSVSKKNVIRGLHYQLGEKTQAKLVRCTAGRIFDVLVDLRKSSSTFSKWYGVELSADKPLCLYIPRGFAHGYAALTDDAAILYKADNHYCPDSEGGLRWDDPELAISWPVKKPLLSKKDAKWPAIKEAQLFD